MSEVDNSVSIELKVQDGASSTLQSVGEKAKLANDKLTALEKTLKAINDIELKFKSFDMNPLAGIEEKINKNKKELEKPIKITVDIDNVEKISKSMDATVKKVSESVSKINSLIADISHKEIIIGLQIDNKNIGQQVASISREINDKLQNSVKASVVVTAEYNKMATDRPNVAATRMSDGVNYKEWEKDLKGYLDAKKQIDNHYNELGAIHLKYMADEKARQDKELSDQRAHTNTYNNELKSNMDREVAAWRAQQQELKRIADERVKLLQSSQNMTFNSQISANMIRGMSQSATQTFNQSTTTSETARQVVNPQQTSVINELSNSLNKLQQTLMMVGVAMSGRQIMEYADQWTHFTNAVGIATEKTGDAAGMQERLFKLAQDNRAPLESITSIYLRMSRAAETLNMTQGQTVQMIDTVTKSLAIMGTSPNAVRGGLLQLEQALGGVTVRGQEFKSILDSMPQLMGIVVKHYDEAAKNIKLEEAAMRGASKADLDKIKSEESHIKTLADLRNAMYAGKVSSEAFKEAILLGQKEVDEIFNKTHHTFSQAFTVIENGFTKWIGKLNETSLASEKFFGIAKGISQNFDLIAKALAGLGAGFGTYALLAGGFFLAITNPITAAISLTVGLGVAFDNLKDEIKIDGSLATWGDAFEVVLDDVKGFVDTVKSLFSAIPTAFEYVIEHIANNPKIKALISVFEKMSGSVNNYVDSVMVRANQTAASRVPLVNEPLYVTGKTPSLYELGSANKAAIPSANYPQLPATQSNQFSLRPQVDISGISKSNFMKDTLGAEAYDNLIAKIEKARDAELNFKSVVQDVVALTERRASEEARIAGLPSEKERFVMKEYYKDLQSELGAINKATKSNFANIEELLDFTQAKGIDMLAPVREKYEKLFDSKKLTEATDRAIRDAKTTLETLTPKIQTDDEWLKQELEKVNKQVELQSVKNPVKMSISMELNKESQFKAVNQYNDLIKEKASKYGVDPNLMQSIIGRESGGNKLNEAPYVNGKPQGQGLAQFTPDTQKDFGITNWKDPVQQIDAQARYLVKALEKTGGDVEKAIILYHNGLYANVDKVLANKKSFPATMQYVKDVMSDYAPGKKSTQQIPESQVKASQELVTLQSRLAEFDEIKKQRNEAILKSDAKRAEELDKQLTLIKKQVGWQDQAYIKANEIADAEIRANVKLREEAEKLNAVRYKNIHEFDDLKKKQTTLTSAKDLASREGLGAIPKIDSMILQDEADINKMREQRVSLMEKELFLQSSFDISKDQTVLAELLKLQERRYSLETTINDKISERRALSNIEIETLNRINQAKQAFEDKLAVARDKTTFGGLFGGKSDLDRQIETEAKSQGVMSSTGKIIDETKYAKLKSQVEELANLDVVNKSFDMLESNITSGFTTMFTDVLSKGKSFTDAFRDMFKNLVSNISSSLMNIGMQAMMSGNWMVGGAAMIGGMAISLLQTIFKGKTVDTSTPESLVSGSAKGTSESSQSLGRIDDTLNSIHAKEYKALLEIADGFKNLTRAVDNTINQAVSGQTWKGSTKVMSGTSSPTIQGVNPAGSPGMIAGGLLASTAAGAAGVGIAGAGLTASTAIGLGMGTATSVGVGVGSSAMAIGGAVLGLAGGVIFAALQFGLGSLLGIGKTKYEVIGSGIVSGVTEFILGGAQKQIQVFDYSKVKATTKGWFSDDVQIYDVVNRQNPAMTSAISSVFNNFNAVLAKSVQGLNIADMVDTMFNVPKIKLDLKKLKPEEVTKKITDSLNTTMDDIVADVTNGILTPFQKMGEGMLQTLIRVYSDVVVVTTKFKNLGIDMGETNLGLVTFTENLVDLNESSDKAGDGLKNFINVLDAFYNAVTTKGEKFDQSAKNLVSALEAINAGSIKVAETSKARSFNVPVEQLANPNNPAAVELQNAVTAIFAKMPELTSVAIKTDVNTLKGSDLLAAADTFTKQAEIPNAIISGFEEVKALFPNTSDFAKLQTLRPESYEAIIKKVGSPEKLASITMEQLDKLGLTAKFQSNATKADAAKGVNEIYAGVIALAKENSKDIISRANFNIETFIKERFSKVLEADPKYESDLKAKLKAIFESTDPTFINAGFETISTYANKLSSDLAGLADSTLKTEKTFTEVTNFLKESIKPVIETILSSVLSPAALSSRADTASLTELSVGTDITSIINESSSLLVPMITEWLAGLTTVQKASLGITDSIKITERALKAYSNAMIEANKVTEYNVKTQLAVNSLITSEGKLTTEYEKRMLNNAEALRTMRDVNNEDEVHINNLLKQQEVQEKALVLAKRKETVDAMITAGLSDYEKEAFSFNQSLIAITNTFGENTAAANEFIATMKLTRDITKAASFVDDVTQASYDKKYSLASDADKKILALEKYKNDMIKKYGNETISGVEGTLKKSDAMVKLYVDNLNAVDFSKAVQGLRDFRRTVAEWAINLQITQLGSTRSQLDTAQGKLAYQLSAYKSSTGVGSIDMAGITDKNTIANLNKYMAQTEIANKGKTVADIKSAIEGSITGTADQTITAIRNFYGSSKEGNDLIQQVIDSVTVMPQMVDPQLRMVDLLEDIKKGIFVLPDVLKGTTLGDSITASFTSLQNVIEKTVPSNLKVATVDAMANAIYNAVGLGLSSFSDTFKEKGADILDSTTSSILNVIASLGIPEEDKVGLIERLSVSMEQYKVLIEAKIADPTAQLDKIMMNYQSIVLINLETINALITESMTIAGQESGINFVSEVTKAIESLAGIKIPAFDVSAAIASIDGIVAAAQAALAALQAIGAQRDAELARQTAINTQIQLATPTTTIGTISGGGTKTYADDFKPVMSKASFEGLAVNYGYSGDYNDIAAMIDRIHYFAPNEHGSFYDDYGNIQQFASGGAFTNGIVTKPTSFNMGLMGEAGSEAIMPLTNVNGSLGVRAIAANDSGNNEEELAELKKQNRLLQAQIEVMQAAFQTLIKQNEVTNDKLDSIDSTTRKQVNG